MQNLMQAKEGREAKTQEEKPVNLNYQANTGP